VPLFRYRIGIDHTQNKIKITLVSSFDSIIVESTEKYQFINHHGEPPVDLSMVMNSYKLISFEIIMVNRPNILVSSFKSMIVNSIKRICLGRNHHGEPPKHFSEQLQKHDSEQ